jgi:long-chain fatty acid transport protein
MFTVFGPHRAGAPRHPPDAVRARPTRHSAGVVLLGGLFATSALATDGLEPIASSMRANARGGADVAVGDTALSQIDNPAILAWYHETRYRLDLDGQLGFATAPWRGPYETANSEAQFIPLGSAGFLTPLDKQNVLGLALHSKAGLGTRYRMRHLLIPWMDRQVGGDLKVVDAQVNLGYRLSDKLALGAGARVELATAKFSTVLGPADVDFSRAYAVGGGFQLGAHYRARPNLAFGLAYRSPTWYGDLDGANVDASLFGVLPVSLGAGRIENFRLPQRVAAGAAWDVTTWLKLVTEARWLNYNGSTFHDTDLAADGVLQIRYPFPLGYRDQWIGMLGAEFRLSEHWVFGTGYHYATAPVPPRNMLPMGATISQHHITLGLRYEAQHWWAGVGYVLALPTRLAGGGQSAIPLGVDYAHGEIEQTQHILALGLGFSWGGTR